MMTTLRMTMPIEIKELHIRVSVNPPQNGTPGADVKSGAGNGSSSDEKRSALVAECVEQVMEVLQSKSER
jgi:hypothetical protein